MLGSSTAFGQTGTTTLPPNYISSELPATSFVTQAQLTSDVKAPPEAIFASIVTSLINEYPQMNSALPIANAANASSAAKRQCAGRPVPHA